MRVLMIAPEPYFEPRGTPISVLQRARALSYLGHQVDLVTYHVGEDVPVPGVTIHRIPKIPFVHRVKPGPSLAKLVLDGFLFWRVFGRLCRDRYHVIHSHEEGAFFGMILSAIFRTRHVYDMHSSLPRQLENFEFRNLGPVVQVFEWLEWAVLRTCDAVITIGEDLEGRVRAVNPNVPVRRIENLPIRLEGEATQESPSVGDLRRRLQSQRFVPVVYTGTFERYQGLELLLDSASILAQREVRFALILVGGKPEQIRALEQTVQRKGLTNRVFFTGSVSLDQALEHLQLAEILVSPRIQGTSVPLKIYSYLHAERPILATNVPAHTHVLNEQTALLVEPSAAGLAEGILRLIEDPELGQRLAQASKEFARRRYAPEDYVADLEALYNGLLRHPARADSAVRPTEN